MKSMKIDRVINFPFPTPPPRESLESAEKLLLSIGALRILPCKGSLKEMKEGMHRSLETVVVNRGASVILSGHVAITKGHRRKIH